MRDVFFADFFFEHGAALLALGQIVLGFLQFALGGGEFAIADFSDFREFAGAFEALLFGLQLVDFAFNLANARYGIFLDLPLGLQRIRFFAQRGEFFLDFCEALARMRVGFFRERLTLDFDVENFPLDFVDFGGQGIKFHAQASGGFIDQVDGLIGEKAIGDIALRKHRRRDNGGVLNAHAVVHFVAFFQTAQDGDGVFDGRFGNDHGLKTALERRVFFDVLAVFVERGGADGAEFASRERGLQHVGSVHRAFRSASADESVEFVDEKNNLAFGFGDFLENGFQAILELAAVFRAGDQRRQIESHDALGLQDFRHVSSDDALREAFHDGCFAHAGLAN